MRIFNGNDVGISVIAPHITQTSYSSRLVCVSFFFMFLIYNPCFLSVVLPKVWKQYDIQFSILLIHDNLDRILLCPIRISVSIFFPFLIMLCNTIKQHFFGFLPGLSGIFYVVVCTKEILFLLEHNLGNILSSNLIHPFVSGGIIRWNFLAFQHINRGSGNMS